MRNRFKDALQSQDASNPGALCRSLAEIQTQMYAEGKGTDEVRADPACRLIAYQIAYLFNTAGLDQLDAYAEATHACEQHIDAKESS